MQQFPNATGASGFWGEGQVEKLERIAGRLAHAVSAAEQTPEEMLESASLVAALATEFEAVQQGRENAEPEDPVPAPDTTATIA
jgi:hypothetical protein